MEQVTKPLRDTRANVRNEIVDVVHRALSPVTVKMIRAELKYRHQWAIGLETVEKFTNELVGEEKIRRIRRVNGVLTEVYTRC